MGRRGKLGPVGEVMERRGGLRVPLLAEAVGQPRGGLQNVTVLGWSACPGHGSRGTGERAESLAGWGTGSRDRTPGGESGNRLARVFPVLPDQRGPLGPFLVLLLSGSGARGPDGSENGRSDTRPICSKSLHNTEEQILPP